MYKQKRKKWMLVYIVLIIFIIALGVWYYNSLDVNRVAQDEPFFDVFPEAERNTSSYLVGIANADMLFFGKKGEAYHPFTKTEQKELRGILNEIRISDISEEEWVAESLAWRRGYPEIPIGFKKYTMELLYLNDMPILRFTDVRNDDNAYYLFENWEQADSLKRFLDEMVQKYEPVENTDLYVGIWIGWRWFFYGKFYRYVLPVFVGGMTVLLLVGLGIIWLHFHKKEKTIQK